MQTCIWPSWCHCDSLSVASVKSGSVLPFWYRLTRVFPEKGPLNGCVYVCVCVFGEAVLLCFASKWTAAVSPSSTIWSAPPPRRHSLSNLSTYRLYPSLPSPSTELRRRPTSDRTQMYNKKVTQKWFGLSRPRVERPTRHNIGHFGGGLHSQSLDWYRQTKHYSKIQINKLNTNQKK